MAIVWLEGLGKLKKSDDLIGNRTHYLPACNIVPQPTMLLCTLMGGGEYTCTWIRGVYEYAIEMGLVAFIYTPNFIRGDTQTRR
jgi:hypothetical protein